MMGGIKANPEVNRHIVKLIYVSAFQYHFLHDTVHCGGTADYNTFWIAKVTDFEQHGGSS